MENEPRSCSFPATDSSSPVCAQCLAAGQQELWACSFAIAPLVSPANAALLYAIGFDPVIFTMLWWMNRQRWILRFLGYPPFYGGVSWSPQTGSFLVTSR